MKKRILSLPLLLALILLLPACGSDDNTYVMDEDYEVDSGDVDYVRVSDPREGAFTIEMPRGWRTQVSMERPHGMVRSCGVSISPDGNTRIFFGDPTIPIFMNPTPEYGMYEGMNTGNPLSQIRAYQEAPRFFSDYVQRTYGRLPGFRLLGSEENPYHRKLIEKQARKLGMTPHISTVKMNFSFIENGATYQGQINGATLAIQGVWMADVFGFLTNADPKEAEEIINEVSATFETNPEWQKQEDLRNQQQMAQQNAAHQQRMQQNQRNFEAHQNRMQQRYQAADAQNQAWRDQQAANDRSHERFIDNIRGEETVISGSGGYGGGYTGKVEAGYNNYYVNPNTGEYIGTNSYDNPDPSLYEHWKRKY